MEKKLHNIGEKPVNYTINDFDNLSDIGMLKIFIPKLIEALWPYPEAIFYILKNSGEKDFRDNLANFIVNNFYSNKLSSNYLENNLLYVFTMMFKDEIEQLESLNDIPFFFENSRSSVLLEKMIHMPDIQMYFRKILFQMIEKIENVSSSKKINFNMDIIMQDTKNYIESEKKRLGKKNKKTNEELTIKYINSHILEQSMNIQNLDSQDVDINELKQNIFLDSKISTGDILDNAQAISFNWAMRSILDLIEKIPIDYKENDYEKFFAELTHNIEESIDQLNFEKLFLFKKKRNNLVKMENYYENYIKLLDDKIFNDKVKDFVEKSCCPVEVVFCYDEEEQIFDLRKSNINKKYFKDSDILEYPKDDKFIFKTVLSFSKYFPDLNVYQDAMDINPLKLIEVLFINTKLFNYFNIIKSYFIQENKDCEPNTYDQIYDEKIKNYVMNRIYKKIYPREIENNDSKLFEKTMHLSWVEPQMLIPQDITMDELDKVLPEILEEFKKLNKANSPFIKFKCFKKIFDFILYLINFNDEGEGKKRELGAEDIAPYLNFVLIRACPVRIFTDIEFVKLFMKNNEELPCDLVHVYKMCEYILDSTHETYNVSENEYIKKCNEAIINNKSNNAKRFNEIIERFEIPNI